MHHRWGRGRLGSAAAHVVATIALSLAATGCPASPSSDAGTRTDAGPRPDAGGRDAGGGGAVCGNGVVEAGEDCDGTDLGDMACDDRGFAGGTLACSSTCTFDDSGCTQCGNLQIDGSEECDGTALGGATCMSEGFEGGDIACAADCTLDLSACSGCGNGAIDGMEECDGAALGGATCMSRGYDGGALGCTSTCGFDESACTRMGCGDGTRGAMEDCDGSDLGAATCVTLGYASGTLTCSAACAFDTSACTSCGNGSIQGAEQCDGSDLGGQDCAGLAMGFTGGTLACNSSCMFNTAGCVTVTCGNGMIDGGEACDDGNPIANDGCTGCMEDAGFNCVGAPSVCNAVCGNNMIHGGEECDGTALGGATCVSLGYDAGTLTCTSCTFNTTACTSNCGNGTLDAGEECDDGNRTAFDGCDATCHVDANFHLPVRLRDGPGSNEGRVEVLFGTGTSFGTWRDICDDGLDPVRSSAPMAGTNFANVVCRQLGFTGTGHTTMTVGGGTDAPLMDEVVCSGTEANLSQCAFDGWDREDCSGVEAVGVRCVPGEGDIRLTGTTFGTFGRLQVFHAGAWGEVCDDLLESGSITPGSRTRFTYDTLCQQMGYAYGDLASSYDAPTDTFQLDNLLCTGTERRAVDCPHNAFGDENCVGTEAMGLYCYQYVDGDERLVAGSTRNSGRIEVLHNHVWGTVCDDGLEFGGTTPTRFVDVGCNALGYSGTGSVLLYSSVPDGTDPITLDDVVCAGTELTVATCASSGFGVHNCSHFEDVGLSCAP
ncbi:MAG: DUF4215 domain-containing protein [Sandaracinaceae bacterium]